MLHPLDVDPALLHQVGYAVGGCAISRGRPLRFRLRLAQREQTGLAAGILPRRGEVDGMPRQSLVPDAVHQVIEAADHDGLAAYPLDGVARRHVGQR